MRFHPAHWIAFPICVLLAQDADQWYRDGLRSLAARRHTEAIPALRQSVAVRPEFAPAWKALGIAYASTGEIESAEAAFSNACTRMPSLEDACLYHGRTLYLLNRFQPAVEVLRRAAGLAESAEAHRLLALSLEGLGQIPEAGAEFRTAIRLVRNGPPDEDPGIDYAVFLFRQGRTADAVEPVSAALKRHPDSARAHLEYGCILMSLDRLEEAGAHLERAVAISPQSPRAHLLLGKVYLRLGKPEAAEDHLRQGSRASR